VVTAIAGRKSVRIDYYTGTKSEAERIRRAFGGMVRKLTAAELQPVQRSKPGLVKIRNSLVVTSERGAVARRRLGMLYPGRIVLSIPAEMAFGTGGHATTAMCLRLLVDWIRTREPEELRRTRQLDLGTGTGILALAGRLLGIGSVAAWDYDPAALRAAARNIRAHGIRDDAIELSGCDLRFWKPGRERYEVVTANLYFNMLEEVFAKIRRVMAKGAVCIGSGILREQEEDCLGAARGAGLKIAELRRQGKWIAFRAE
jgi:ribosomal protein L11 methyltransferase